MATIYHYTTAAAFLGMMQNCTSEHRYLTMWATHAMYLNDPTEYQYGKVICHQILSVMEEIMGIASKDRVSEMLKNSSYIREMAQIRDEISSMRPNRIHAGVPYVISFSKRKDDLFMWRTYAQNGDGLAIGFNRDKLSKHVELYECTYDVDNIDYDMLIGKVKKDYDDFLSKRQKAIEPLDKDLVALQFFSKFYPQFASFFKHQGYEGEQEVRCRANKASTIQFRDAKGLIVPYVEVEIPIECINSIFIGPTARTDLVRNSLYMMWHKYNINGIHVEPSTIQYRG